MEFIPKSNKRDINVIKNLTLSDKIFPYITIFIFTILAFILILRHEMWMDEVMAWEMANPSNSFIEMLKSIKGSYGHPYLWLIILFLIKNFVSTNVEIIKIFHLLISIIVNWLFLKYSPFNKIIKCLFVFSYFVFYEYTIISRNYSIGILFLFIFCILFIRDKNKYLIILGISFLFVSQSNLFSFAIGLSLLSILIYEVIKNKFYFREKSVNKFLQIINLTVFTLFILLSFVLLFVQFRTTIRIDPNQNTLLADISGMKLTLYLQNLSYGIIKGFLPIFNLNIHFWNNNLLISHLENLNIIYSYILSIIIFLVTLLLLKKKYMLSYIFGIMLISILIFIYPYCNERHFGNFFILFISLFWLSEKDESSSYLIKFKKFSQNNIFYKLKYSVLVLILILPLFGSITAYYYDFKYPFSSAKNVANFIKQNFDKDTIEKDLVLVGYRWSPAVVASYLDKDICLPVIVGSPFTRMLTFDNSVKTYAQGELKAEETFKIARSFMFNNEKKNLVIVIFYKFNVEDAAKLYGFNKFGPDFVNSIVHTEDFYVYIDEFYNKKVNYSIETDAINFENYWGNFAGFNYEKDNGIINIKSLNIDPNFESKIGFRKFGKDMIINTEINTNTEGNTKIYLKYRGKNFNENDTIRYSLKKGLNNLSILIKGIDNLSSIRFDPIDNQSNVQIKKINFYFYK